MGKKIGAKKNEESFEDMLEKLERTVLELEDGGIPLADSLAGYEQGIKHLRACYAMLENAQQRIEILSGVDAEGNPITEPLMANETTAQQGSRRKKRSTRSKKAASSDAEGDENEMDDDARLF